MRGNVRRKSGVSSPCRNDHEGVFPFLLGSGDVLLMTTLRFYDFTLLSVGFSIRSRSCVNTGTPENDRGMRQKFLFKYQESCTLFWSLSERHVKMSHNICFYGARGGLVIWTADSRDARFARVRVA
jgi:hypothetical protein